MKGIVVKSTGSWITVWSEEMGRVECRLKGQFRIRGIRSTNPVAIGDHVDFGIEPNRPTGVITRIHERDNYIVRRSIKLSKASQIIAANLDFAWLVATLADPKTSSGFIDRFLVTATGYYIPAGIIFNKIDIYDRELEDTLHEWTAIYEEAGYRCVTVSALRGDGIAGLREMIAGKVTLFSGHSGVGKSALLKALEPTLNPRIGDISGVHRKGMHTTTFAEMYELKNGGFIIDTPGIREFSLIHFEKAEIPRCFPEMDRLLPQCQFSNCTHLHEPGCAVMAAVDRGEVSRMRYNSYLSILKDEELNETP